MKYLILFCFFISQTALAQTERDTLSHQHIHGASMGFYSLATGLAAKTVWGGGFEFEVYLNSKYATGLTFDGSFDKKIREHFNYTIGIPLIDYFEIGWLNHYDLWETNRLLLNMNLNNGLAIVALSDDSIKVRVATRYGHTQVPKTIASNYYYFVEPGTDLLIKLGHEGRGGPQAYLTAKFKYHFLFGDSKFGTARQFSNYTFGIGFVVMRRDTGVSEKKRHQK